jgi:hypothetical protein
VSLLCSVKQKHVSSQGWAVQFSKTPFYENLVSFKCP